MPQQPPLIQALLRPEAHPGADSPPQIIETHISWVILSGPCVYKIKKPLDLGFLDYTTLEKRRLCCEREVRLNRRLAPHLYRGVVPITGTPEAPCLGGAGEPIEYAVRMNRFDDDALMSRALERGAVQGRHVDELADTLAAFHASIDRAAPDAPHGGASPVRRAVTECLDRIADARVLGSRTDDLAFLRDWVVQTFDRVAPLLENRKRDGFVRECHGDSHLGNMILEGEHVTLFDGIEFNERFRWIDVLSEAAYTEMDFAARGRGDLGRRFTNRYLDRTGDHAGLPTWRLFKTYRALVRAKVAAIRLDQEGPDAEDADEQEADFTAHFDLALRTARPRPNRLFLTHGPSGSGKSTLAAALAERREMFHVRSDVERRRLAGADPLGDDDADLGEAGYTPRMTDDTYDALHRAAEAALADRHDVIVDATFLKADRRRRFIDLARRHQATCTILDCRAPDDVMARRLEQRTARGDDPSEATFSVLHAQLQRAEPLTRSESELACRVDTDSPHAIQGLLDSL